MCSVITMSFIGGSESYMHTRVVERETIIRTGHNDSEANAGLKWSERDTNNWYPGW